MLSLSNDAIVLTGLFETMETMQVIVSQHYCEYLRPCWLQNICLIIYGSGEHL